MFKIKMKNLIYISLFFFNFSSFAQDDTLRSVTFNPEISVIIRDGIKLLNNKQEEKAIELFRKGADKNNDICQLLLGRMFETGTGTKMNLTQAEKWYKKSADNGNPQALFQLGRFSKNGFGGQVKFKDAINYLKAAADEGIPNALYAMGYMFFKGFGVAQDYCKAIEYYNAAAMKKSVAGYFALGYCYENGYGIEKNDTMALKLYSLAANSGYEQAKIRLKKIMSGKPKSAGIIPQYLKPAISESHIPVFSSNRTVDLSKKLSGCMIIYDWSGQQIEETFPIEICRNEKKQILVTISDSPQVFQVVGNAIRADGLSFKRDGAFGEEVIWELKSITFMETEVGEDTYLFGDAVIWSPELKEPGEKVQIVLYKGPKSTSNTLTESFDVDQLKAYPNPFNQQVNIEFYLQDNSTVSLYITDENGQIVKSVLNNENLEKGNYMENVEGFYSTGIYLVILKAGDFMKTVKIIKTN